MHELITQLTEKAGITPEQAHKAIDAIKDFVKEKFPMMAGAVDNLFASEGTDASGAAGPGAGQDAMSSMKDKLGGMFGG